MVSSFLKRFSEDIKDKINLLISTELQVYN